MPRATNSDTGGAPESSRDMGGQGEPVALSMREAVEKMARRMTSAWPRRGHNLLEMFCADGYFLEVFWQSGFDVTGQDQNPSLLALARERLKNTADLSLSHPESLPYDDHSFDYVVCINGLESAESPSGLISEMFRLATRGVLLAFPNSWSLHGLGRFFCCRVPGEKFFSPMRISSMMRRADASGTGQLSWASTLHGPGLTWHMPGLTRLNSAVAALPLGAITMLRLDFNPPLGSSSILVTGKRVLRREAASSGVGRVGKVAGHRAPIKN